MVGLLHSRKCRCYVREIVVFGYILGMFPLGELLKLLYSDDNLEPEFMCISFSFFLLVFISATTLERNNRYVRMYNCNDMSKKYIQIIQALRKLRAMPRIHF